MRASSDVRFWGNSGHRAEALQCPLLTQSGHQAFGIAAVQTGPWSPFRRSQIRAVIPLAEQRIWNRHDHSRASLRHLAFLHEQPQHAPHNQGDQSSRSQIFGNRHDCPRFGFPMSEILLAIAPTPRRELGNFSTLMRNFLDWPRCISLQRNAVVAARHNEAMSLRTLLMR